MPLSRVDENDLLIPLHEGLHETPRWATFLGRLRRRTRADRALLVIRHNGQRSLESPDFVAFSSPDDSRLGLFDPLRYPPLRPGRVYGGEELAVRSSQPAPYFRVVRLEEPGEAIVAWVFFLRDQEDFFAADSALLTALVPHLVVALRTFAALEAERARLRIAAEVSPRLGVGWVLLDAEARVIDADPFADRLLRSSLGMVRLVGERLHIVASEGGQALTRAADAFAADPGAGPRIVSLSIAPRLSMLVIPAPEDLPLLAPGSMIGMVRMAPDAAPHRAEAIAALFGLPISEARLASALTAGASIAEAAEALSLTLETARNYSKRTYAKTGARGQADLVRLILSSVAALG